ncbi:hypothetical protein TrVE_jg6137 [Triparma verrucosa]|nr:hypothetical protein TrVE_jg6137 [Triparma verrucosa]
MIRSKTFLLSICTFCVLNLCLPFNPLSSVNMPKASDISIARSQRDFVHRRRITTELNAESEGLDRRQFNELAFAATGLGVSFLGTRENSKEEYGLWGVLPIGPYKRKKTIMEEIVPDEVWTFDQKFGILNVQVPVRSVVVKLSEGGLLVYNPVAATQEFLDLLKPLVSKYGEVKHIVLGTVAIEHKVYAGVFAQKFSKASVWLQPGQYAFPSNLPNSFLGFPAGRTRPIPESIEDFPTELKEDFDKAMIGPLISRDGAFGETVLYHKKSKTLLVTDTVLEVTDEVPPIFRDDPAPLIYHARDTITDVVDPKDEATLRRGWRRVVLFGLFFQPSAIKIKEAGVAFKERLPSINPDFLGIYPWDWIGDDNKSFEALTGGLLVAPILQKLILNRNPVETLDFADTVSKWDIVRIIPAHLKNNLKYNGADYRAAFDFLTAEGPKPGKPKPLEADFQTLNDANVNLLESGAVSPTPPLPGTPGVTRQEIIAKSAYGCRDNICSPKAKA